ncbi:MULTISPECIES: helix-turn-helix domain-containing protein [unclassified Sulfitobacter]|uniref:helix-turn-helix domain-containing protein n=1 Tax=unclassified Sulfitobacter TaxID=196795 RepID=UPI000A476010|nr:MULTISPECIES: helix-turn-helix domain-containing protein [unclassified Sulfitobacter]
MNINEKEQLTRLGDMSKEACALRLLVARDSTGLSQLETSQQAGIANNALNNMEKGRQFPNREIMKYFYRAHRIDFNFLMHGDFAQLPQDVQKSLFANLSKRSSELDQKERSDQS